MAHQLTPKSRSLLTVPIFLAPAFSNASSCSSRSFSTSPQANTQVQRGNRDKSKKRGVSAIRSTGPRHRLSITRLGPLPKPRADPTEARAAFAVDPNHGLWGFFNKEREAVVPSSEEDSHGRAWTVEELSKKGWEDLHKLYWACVKEANIVATRNNERDRLKLGYGVHEGDVRLADVSKTMRNIRQALVQRHYARFDATQLLYEKHMYELFPDILSNRVGSIAPELLELENGAHDDASTLNEQPGVSQDTSSAQGETPKS